MSYQVGDLVFQRSGQPGLLVARDKENNSLVLDTKSEKLQKAQKYGYINGLSPNVRAEYEGVIDDVRQSSEPKKRLEHLKTAIDGLGDDPEKFALRRYLKSEMAHIMNTFRIRPESYQVDEEDVV